MSRIERLRSLAAKAGPGMALKVAMHRAYSAWWERRLGVETAGDHLLESEGLGSPDHHDHSASSVWDMQRALRLASAAPERDVFIDFGSGKGRALLVAAERPFRRVIGAELSPALAAISQRNIAAAAPRLRCRDVTVALAGADAYEIPADASVLYFYNPFGGSVMAAVVGNIRRSLLASPRPLTVVVATPPRFEQAVAGLGWVKRRAEFMGLRRHAIFDCTAPGNASGG